MQALALVPARQEFPDYAVRMSELLAQLEVVEQRSQVSIARDLRHGLADTIRLVRATTSKWEDGSIPLDAGAALVANARAMVLAAACSAVYARALYASRKPEPAEQYIKKVRMGHTEDGSYAITLISPMTVTLPLFSSMPDPPFERRATTLLVESVAAATRAAMACEARDSLDPLIEAVPLGVSANLLDALVGLYDKSEPARIGLFVSWATATGLDAPPLSQATIPQKATRFFEAASKALKEREPRDDVSIAGFVTDLHRELRLMRDTPQAAGGVITIAGQIDGVPKKVMVELPANEYEKATHSHTQGSPVRAIGNLRKQGRQYHLIDLQEVFFYDME